MKTGRGQRRERTDGLEAQQRLWAHLEDTGRGAGPAEQAASTPLHRPPDTRPGDRTAAVYLEMLAASVPQRGVRNSHSKTQGDQCQIGDPTKSRDSNTVLRKAPSFLLPKKKKESLSARGEPGWQRDTRGTSGRKANY